MIRHRRFVTDLFAGMLAALACVAVGIFAFAVVFGLAPQPGHDPVARIHLVSVTPPAVGGVPPAYQPLTERLEQVGLFVVFSQSALPMLTGLTAPTSGNIDSHAARDMSETPSSPPQLDMPASDRPLPYGDATVPPSTPHLGDVGEALSNLGPGPNVDLRAVMRSSGNARRDGPEHFLQSGYFADRENAIGLSRNLANAGLDVLMEQTTNRAGSTRWRVLVGPYRQKEDAVRARSRAPDLLADAFHKMRRK